MAAAQVISRPACDMLFVRTVVAERRTLIAAAVQLPGRTT